MAGKSERGDLGADFLLRAPDRLLQTAEQLVPLAFDIQEVVIREVGILLLQLALYFVPGAFDFEFVHSANASRQMRPLDASL